MTGKQQGEIRKKGVRERERDGGEEESEGWILLKSLLDLTFTLKTSWPALTSRLDGRTESRIKWYGIILTDKRMESWNFTHKFPEEFGGKDSETLTLVEGVTEELLKGWRRFTDTSRINLERWVFFWRWNSLKCLLGMSPFKGKSLVYWYVSVKRVILMDDQVIFWSTTSFQPRHNFTKDYRCRVYWSLHWYQYIWLIKVLNTFSREWLQTSLMDSTEMFDSRFIDILWTVGLVFDWRIEKSLVFLPNLLRAAGITHMSL